MAKELRKAKGRQSREEGKHKQRRSKLGRQNE